MDEIGLAPMAYEGCVQFFESEAQKLTAQVWNTGRGIHMGAL